jgi:uncharacterized protein
MYPDCKCIESLHQKYAVSRRCFILVYTHCRIVNDIAGQIIQNTGYCVNTQLLRSGALLHDIGSYAFMDNFGVIDKKQYIRHGITGYTILTGEKMPEDLCRIAKRHTGVGITAEDIVKNDLPLPPADYTAQTLEEKIIMYSDKFHSKNPAFNSYETCCLRLEKYGTQKVKKFQSYAREFGIPDLHRLAASYKHPII